MIVTYLFLHFYTGACMPLYGRVNSMKIARISRIYSIAIWCCGLCAFILYKFTHTCIYNLICVRMYVVFSIAIKSVLLAHLIRHYRHAKKTHTHTHANIFDMLFHFFFFSLWSEIHLLKVCNFSSNIHFSERETNRTKIA